MKQKAKNFCEHLIFMAKNRESYYDNSFPANCLHTCYCFFLKCISSHSLSASYSSFRSQLKYHFLRENVPDVPSKIDLSFC